MNNKVCMFVWNHFTNDARVLRECTALSEAGYFVDLICIDDPKDSSINSYEKRNELFHVHRVRRYPYLLELIQKGYRYFMQNKIIGLLAILFWVAFSIFFPIFGVTSPILGFLLLKTKIKTIWIRGSIILRMILKGYAKKYDIYHSNDLNTLPQGYLCSKFRFKKKKLIYDSHEVQSSRTGYDSPIYGKLEKLLIFKVDRMIVENHTRAKYNEDLYGFYPNVIHNYPFKGEDVSKIEKSNLHNMLDLPLDEKILLYQGGIQEGRGLEKLVKAAPLINEGTIVFIGDGRIKHELEKMVEDMDLQNKVKFIPKVPLNELPSYTKNAYLGYQILNNVCFNHYSASSNKLFEYMMSEVPVVACSFPEIKKVVENEHVGVCVDSHDYEDIARGTNYLLENVQEKNRMVQNCRIVKDKYNWDREKVNLIDLYQN